MGAVSGSGHGGKRPGAGKKSRVSGNEILILRMFRYKWDEIAEALGVSKWTAMAAARRAKGKNVSDDTKGVGAIIVIGRPLANYMECGDTVPPDRVVLRCLGCKTPVAITAEANQKLATVGRQPGVRIAGAMCQPCGTRAAEVGGRMSGCQPFIGTTTHGAKRVAEDPQAARFLEDLKKKAERP